MKYTLLLSLMLFSTFLSGQGLQQLLPHSNSVIHHEHYSLSYSEAHEQAEWVMYELTASEAQGGYARTDNFRADPLVGTGSAGLSDYKGSGYDRGHLAPAADMGFSPTAISESFYLSNMSPQDPSFNRGIWKRLEGLFRSWAVEDGELHIVTGPVLTYTIGRVGPNEVSVPSYYYKVALDYDEEGFRSIAFVLPNTKGTGSLERYVVSIDSLESLTGINFFPGLPDNVENKIEAATTGSWDFGSSYSRNPAKSITSVQCSGITQSNKRCKRSTKEENGYCWQHQTQVDGSTTPKPPKTSSANQCKGTTQSGRRCRRTTKNTSGYCWQHEG